MLYGDRGIEYIEIVDMKGKIILEDATLTNSSIQTCNLPSGIYVVKLYTDDGNYVSKKVIKM